MSFFFSIFPIINLWKIKFAYKHQIKGSFLTNKGIGVGKGVGRGGGGGGGGGGVAGRLLESATSLSGIDFFIFSESVAFLITVLHFVFFITLKNMRKYCSVVVKVVPIPIRISPQGGLAERIIHSCIHPTP